MSIERLIEVDDEELRQLFRNNSDCYADTWKSDRGFMEEGEVLQAMTEEKFIETILTLTSRIKQ